MLCSLIKTVIFGVFLKKLNNKIIGKSCFFFIICLNNFFLLGHSMSNQHKIVSYRALLKKCIL